ncbi:MAG TPA: hypothetical protein ACFCUY_04005 [Xenococcaceae cyanobacterium]
MNLTNQERFIAFTVAIAFCITTLLVILQGMQWGIMAGLTTIVVALCYRYPRQALWLFLVYLPFAGTIGYSLNSVYQASGAYITFTNTYVLIHLVKDVFYFPALIAIVIGSSYLKKLRGTAKSILLAGLILLLVCLLTLFLVNLPQQLANPGTDKSFLMGIIGLKVLVGYIPFLICGYYLVRDRLDLSFILRLHLILILICCILCIVQYWFLVTGICLGNSDLVPPANTRVTLQARCFVGGSLLYNPQQKLISLPGTFVAPWQWAWFLIAGSFLAMGTYLSESSRLWRTISLITVGLVLVAAIISGQTTATLLVPIIFLILIVVTESNKKRLSFKLFWVILLLFLIANNFGIFGSALDDIIARWQYTAPQEFIIRQFSWINNTGIEMLGSGLGKATSAARRWGEIKLIETFYPKLLYQIGWLGTLAFLMLLTITNIVTFKKYRLLENKSLKRLGICLWIFILLISYNTYYYPLLVDPVAIYYWLFAGVLLKLPELEKS